MKLTAVRRAWPPTPRCLSACARSVGAARTGEHVWPATDAYRT
jgi:hypothetical protein